MSEVRFSRKTVCEVTGINPKSIGYFCQKLGIKTGRAGFTADQARQLKSYSSRATKPANFGTADQLRTALANN